MKHIFLAMTFLILIVGSGCTHASAWARGVDRDRAVSVARELAAFKGRVLKNYAEPKSEFDAKQNEWRVMFMGTVIPSPGNYFTVVVNAKTGKAVLIPGE